MKYWKMQKFISYMLLFVFFLNFSVNIPSITSLVFAKESSFYNIVSIIVDEKTYSELKSELERYSRDISWTMENTRVVILPVPEDVSVFSVASMNESLYFDWYKWLNSSIDFESKLVWTVFVWNIPVPTVYSWENSTRTVLPYVDFEEKSFVYNSENSRYEENPSWSYEVKPEVTFWFISPNSWDSKKDIEYLKKYFSKNHDFYTWAWKYSNWLNGNNKELGSNYKPYVFYYDHQREAQSFNGVSYSSYLATRYNNEDLIYWRYTKWLLAVMQAASETEATKDLLTLAKALDPAVSIASQWKNIENIYDIQTRAPIEALKKNFINSYSSWNFWDLRKDVFNAWRYNFWQTVNVDFIPHIISQMDILADNQIKSANDSIEKQVNDIVEKMSRKVAIPTTYSSSEDEFYTNYLFWRKVSDIDSAMQCSVYRWTTQLVQANRAYNIDLIENDINRVWAWNLGSDFSWTTGLWWKNSPLNLETNSAWKLTLKTPADYLWAIEPLFDIKWSNADIISGAKPISVFDCFDNNYLLEEKYFFDPEKGKRLVYKIKWVGWSHFTDNNQWKTYNYKHNFVEDDIKNFSDPKVSTTCDLSIYLDWKLIRTLINPNHNETDSDGEKVENCKVSYTYKSVDSVVINNEPTSATISAQAEKMITPNLPISKDRYTTFVRNDWKYFQIFYPNLFKDISWTNIDYVRKSLELYFSKYNWWLTSIYNFEVEEPSYLIWGILDKLEDIRLLLDIKWKSDLISTLLKKSEPAWWEVWVGFPENIDFYIMWNNLSTTEKYSFVFDYIIKKWKEKYPIDEFIHSNYEISYLWASWNAQNMMVWLNPDLKSKNPFADSITRAEKISSQIFSYNVTKSSQSQTSQNGSSPFKCAPPSWVPIWEWLDAVECRLKNTLPPKIWFSEWTCSSSKLVVTVNEKNSLTDWTYSIWWTTSSALMCNLDEDKNGISDCLQSVDKLSLSTNATTYAYNSTIWLTATFYQWDTKATFVNNTPVIFEITKIEKIWDSGIAEVVFDVLNNNLSDEKIISKYLNYSKVKSATTLWESKYLLSTETDDLNIYFKAKSETISTNWIDRKKFESDVLKVEVRSNSFSTFTTIYNKTENKYHSTLSSVDVSDKSNIYLVDLWEKNIENISNVDYWTESEKNFIIWLNKFSRSWKIENLSYPLNIKLFDWNNLTQELEIQNRQEFIKLSPLKKSWEYKVVISDKNWLSTTRKFSVNSLDASDIDISLGSTLLLAWWSVTNNFLTIFDKFQNPVIWKKYLSNIEVSWEFSLLDDSGLELKNISSNIFEWYSTFRLKSLSNAWKWTLTVKVIDFETNKTILTKSVEITSVDNVSTLLEKPNLSVWEETYKFKISILDKNWNVISDLNSRLYFTWNGKYFSTTKDYFEVKNWVAEVEIKTSTLASENIPVEIQVEWIWKIFTDKITINPLPAVMLSYNLSDSKIEVWTLTNLYVELKDKYNNTVFTDSTSEISITTSWVIAWKSEKVSKWKATLKMNSSNIPGVWFFKINVNPSLEENFFTIKDESGEIKVSWVSENWWKIETYYFLKWEATWEEKNYLINWSSLYTVMQWANYWDIEQRDYLAWSMIFSDWYTLTVTSLLENSNKESKIVSINKFWNIKEVYNSADLSQILETSIWIDAWELYFDIFNKSLNVNIWKVYFNLNSIETGICSENFSKCFNSKKSWVYWNVTNPSYKIYNSWWRLFITDSTWNEIISIWENWQIEKKSDLSFELNKNNSWKYLNLILLRWNQEIWNLYFNIVDSEINNSTSREVLDNKRQLTNKNSILTFIESNYYWTKISSWEAIIYYNDLFSSKTSLDSFASRANYGFENYINQGWIWWKDDNKTLLSFASGDSIWESVKDFMWFYTITIWDPFIKLKTLKKEGKQFDSTIWKILSNNPEVIDYKVFDYNNDWKDDILLVKRDNYLELLENKDSDENFISMWNLAQIYDLWSFIETWDFTWDWFDDIFFVWKDWKPYILNNISKDFTRIDLTSKINSNSRISNISAFDMDNDWIMDVTILNENWELDIYYWWWTSNNPTFTNKRIDSWLWVSLSSTSRTDWWILYYTWLYQPSENLSVNSSWKSKIQNSVIDSEIYVNLPYSKTEKILNLDNIQELTWTQEQTYFLKSEYLDSIWIDYKKIFKDRNWWTILTWDIVDVEIKIKNNSWKYLNNLILQEKVENYFNFDKSTLKNSKDLNFVPWLSSYNFGLEKFNLWAWEEIVITYSLTAKKLSSFTLRTWLFETKSSWDDKFWDIIVDDLNTTCWAPLWIYNSISAREYEKTKVVEQCDISKLPEELNNIYSAPDKESPVVEQQKYAKEKLAELNQDSDKDWIPDNTDFYDNVSWALDEAQDLLNWLSCWFNNWACISTPLNWAPLAPGWDPTFMGQPIWDGFLVEEWLPIFSALTWMQAWPYCVPSVWPVSPLWSWCSWLWAWWMLWVDSPTNFLRIFVTPTLTGWVWTAICMWWPASTIWYNSNPMWLAPLFPGWNCIVIAKPIVWCSNDGSEWNPASVWQPNSYNWYSIINAWKNSTASGSNQTCSTFSWWKNISSNYVWQYISSKWWKTNSWLLETKNFYNSVSSVFKPWNIVSDHSTYDWTPMFNFWWGNWTWINVTIDRNSSDWVDFSDVEQIFEKRIKSFPEFLMDWISRQIDEIISKLTDFPTLFIVLPDFSWIYDSNKSWEENWKDYKEKSIQKWKESVSETVDVIDVSWVKQIIWTQYSDKLGEMWSFATSKINQVNSSVRTAYEFISTLPLVNLNSETVYVNIPWISDAELNRTIASWNETIEQWESERQRLFTLEWLNEEIKWKTDVQISGFIWSVKKNIKVLEEYKKIPEKIRELLNKKEDYLEQIICNVEVISEVTGWWIWKNGERFKAWVELFILIKAILKSWQTFIDIFVEYEQECHQCKNERWDALDYEFQLISMIIPDIPVVKFPKWPDIVLDLHNIRASLDISIPEFEIKTRPINLPDLPTLILPSAPEINWNLKLPDIPILPTFEIPELPDLPSLPEIDLPDLPPPPKLPKLFDWFEIILDIAELITKAMCILKSSPFHPEWRAWDQIAFLTERNGYLSFDFLNKSLPQFSIPFVDSIEVTTYVNLESETEFITEFAKKAVEPARKFTSDFTNKLNIWQTEIDFSKSVPSNIDIDVDTTSSWNKTSYINWITNYILEWLKYFEENKDKTLTNQEFKQSISKILASEKFSWDTRFDEVREVWHQVNNYTFAWEDEIISKLQEFNFEKYNTLIDVLETEKQKTKNTRKDLENIFVNGTIQVSEKNFSSIENYQKAINKYNEKTFENIWNIFTNKSDETSEIRELWNNLLTRTNNVFNNSETPLQKYLLATNSSTNTNLWIATNNSWTCSVSSNNNWYSYNYTWIYVIEDWKSYRLFDYTDEISGEEQTKPIDFDKDWDEDLLYFVNNTLYLKENFKEKNNNKKYIPYPPITVYISDNKFLKTDFIESVNNATETTISNKMINISFSSLKNIYNYRLSFYDIIDKSLNKKRDETDINKNLNIIDWVVSDSQIYLIEENNLFVKSKDIAYISQLWNFRNLELSTYKLKSIKEDLLSWKTVTLSSWTKLYSWANISNITYKTSLSDTEEKIFRLEPNQNIEAKQDIVIVWINWDWYVETTEEVVYNWDEISKMRWMPLLFGSKISYVWDKNNLKNNSYLEIEFYDKSLLNLDFNTTSSWQLYDLWDIWEDYLFSVNRENNYYYAKLNWFKNNKIWTSTQQILLSPQLKADRSTPEISLKSVKIPIYQEREIDITSKVTENSWVDWISKIYVDFFIETDTDWDLDTKNDDDSSPTLSIYKKDWKIFLKAWKYSSLINKKVWINIIDENGNKWYKEINFEVYSPVPEIESYDWTVISWKISEEISQEPINFYRFRWWELSRLWDEKDVLTVFTNDSWKYSLKTWLFEWWLTIKNNFWNILASISEKTWKITLTSEGSIKYSISVETNKDTNYPEIFIKENSWKNIFKQTLRVNWALEVWMVENFENLEKNWVYVKTHQNNYWYYVLPANIINNPWVFVAYNSSDSNKNPILKIYPDWRLELPDNFKLSYNSYQNYILIKISDNAGKNLFDILYKLDADYVIN